MEQIDIVTEKIKKIINKKNKSKSGGSLDDAEPEEEAADDTVDDTADDTVDGTANDADKTESKAYNAETKMDEYDDLFAEEDYEINKTELPEIMSHLEKWSLENKFDYETLMKIISMRDEIISDLLNIGLNPFYNGLGLTRGKYKLSNILKYNITDGIEEIKKIKKCIYDGYRLNLFIWNDILQKYISNVYHYSVSIDSKLIRPLKPDADIKQLRPQKIVVANIMLGSSSFVKGMYEFKGNDISVLDGYVNADVNFVNY